MDECAIYYALSLRCVNTVLIWSWIFSYDIEILCELIIWNDNWKILSWEQKRNWDKWCIMMRQVEYNDEK